MVHSITNFIYHHYGIKRKNKDDFILRYDENGNAIFNNTRLQNWKKNDKSVANQPSPFALKN